MPLCKSEPHTAKGHIFLDGYRVVGEPAGLMERSHQLASGSGYRLDELIVENEACVYGIGSALMQKDGPIAYASHSLSSVEQ